MQTFQRLLSLLLSAFLLSPVAITAVLGQTTTTITGETGDPDSWNQAGNWDNGIPDDSAAGNPYSAIVGDGVTATVNNASTPTYSGGLTLGLGSSIKINSTTGSENAIGTGPIIMNGSTIDTATAADPTFGALTLNGTGGTFKNTSNAADWDSRYFGGTISGSGALTLNGRNGVNYYLQTTNTFSGGLIADAVDRYKIFAQAAGALGTGDITINPRTSDNRSASLYINAADAIADTAKLHLNGGGFSGNGSDRLIMNANDAVSELWIDGTQLFADTYTSAEPWLQGTGTLSVLNGPADLPPTLVSIEDELFESGPNAGFDTIWEDVTVNYTVTFSDDMKDSTVEASDFENGGGATIGIGTVSETLTPPSVTGPSEYGVEVIPGSPGTLQLQIKSGAVLTDEGGNPLDTTVALPDDDTITILPGNMPDATTTGGNWTDPGNWSGGGYNFVPFGPGDAVIAPGATSTVTVTVPEYGGLTLGDGAQLDITLGRASDYDPTILPSAPHSITMGAGSTINLSVDQELFFPAIGLTGDASILNTGSNWNDNDRRNFDGPITGGYQLSVRGRNGSDYHFNAANSFDGLVATAVSSYALRANVSNALGLGDVFIADQVSLDINANDVMGDSARLVSEGNRSTKDGNLQKIRLDGNDTIGHFIVDGKLQDAGPYNSASGLQTPNGDDLINGTGNLTVLGGSLHWDTDGDTAGIPADSTGQWGTDTSWSLDAAGEESTYNWATGYHAVFSGTGTQDVELSTPLEMPTITVEAGTVNLTGTPALQMARDTTVAVESGAASSMGVVIGADGNPWKLTKTGNGTLILQETNTYTGPTRIDGGTLQVAGSLADSSLTTVATGATLGGSGAVGMLTLDGGAIAPGASIGAISAGTTTWNDTSSYLFEIDDASDVTGTPGAVGGPGWDLLDITGTLDISPLTVGGFTIDIDTLLTGGGTTSGLMANFNEAETYAWEFVRSTDGIIVPVGGFDPTVFVFDIAGVVNSLTGTFGVTREGDSLFLNYGPIPEPSTVMLFVLIPLACFRRRVRKRRD